MFERARAGIGYLPQEPSVFRKLSVEDNLRLVLQMSGLSSKEQARRVDGLIEEFNLGQVRHQVGISLSGGERRRAEIARLHGAASLVPPPGTSRSPASIRSR